MRQLAAAGSTTEVSGSRYWTASGHSRVIHPHLLLAGVQGFLLLRCDQAVDLLFCLLPDLLDLLLLLLWCK